FEKDKIKGAIRTDFILSAEILVITLGTVATAAFSRQLSVLVTIAVIVTVGVYGLVAGIVKLDDAGLALMKSSKASARSFGRGLVAFAPKLMKFLSIAGTAAMFTVGGSIIAHGIHPIGHAIEMLVVNAPFSGILKFVLEGVFGLIVGAILVFLFMAIKKLIGVKAK
nr:DUF808 domain-containing protein [Acidiferrobacterales bacterium]